MKSQTTSLAALAAFALAGPASAATLLFSDNFNTAGDLNSGNTFNSNAAGDQSGTAANKTYATAIDTVFANYAYQRGNGGMWLMYANGAQAGSTTMSGSLNYDIAAASNTLNSALEISFNMSVSGGNPNDSEWTSVTVGGVNPFVNDSSVGFSSLFRDSGQTQQLSNGAAIGATATFSDGSLITMVLSDASGSGSAFNSDGATDVVKMYVNGSLSQTWTALDLNAADQYISFNSRNTIGQIDNLTITAIPEPGAALLGGFGMLALLRRRRWEELGVMS